VSGNLTSKRHEIDVVFGRALPLIDSILIRQYALPREEASEVERSLYEWFHGFARRPGSPASCEGLRSHLLSMACQTGHVYWAGKPDAVPATDENVRRALALGPQQIAIELEESAKQEEVAELIRRIPEKQPEAE
jgi:hypothetical protein